MKLLQWYLLLASHQESINHASHHSAQQHIHSRYWKEFLCSLYQREAEACKKHPSQLSFLYQSVSLEEITGVKKLPIFYHPRRIWCGIIFLYMQKNSWVFDNYTQFAGAEFITEKTTSRGRKRLFRVEDCAALVLAWTCTRRSMNILHFWNDNDKFKWVPTFWMPYFCPCIQWW